VHEPSGTPRVATIGLSVVLGFACALPFSQLVSISMLFYGVTTLMEFMALIQLRRTQPREPRPFRVPLSGGALVAACLNAGDSARAEQATHTAHPRALGLALVMPWGSGRQTWSREGLARPLPHHLVRV